MATQQDRLLNLPVPGFQRRWGQNLLRFLDTVGIAADFINRSHEGNLLIEWRMNGNYCMAEMYDDMQVVFLYRGKGFIDAWDLTSTTSIAKIREYLPAAT